MEPFLLASRMDLPRAACDLCDLPVSMLGCLVSPAHDPPAKLVMEHDVVLGSVPIGTDSFPSISMAEISVYAGHLCISLAPRD